MAQKQRKNVFQKPFFLSYRADRVELIRLDFGELSEFLLNDLLKHWHTNNAGLLP